MGYAPASPQIDVNEDRTKRERIARDCTVFCGVCGGQQPSQATCRGFDSLHPLQVLAFRLPSKPCSPAGVIFVERGRSCSSRRLALAGTRRSWRGGACCGADLWHGELAEEAEVNAREEAVRENYRRSR